ncbi:hypothetical protein QBC37DRAFT_123810 [Rhypophila decipiens]|uniref:DUF6536 domain-containing protein n=1 Tax=Rhypophila decipiens TaxID=261697 RepID=A0AAN7BC37_9PEZI|nr:hypothetical protein QBC37DRAFT_123810 [Rhypophila decipiens]
MNWHRTAFLFLFLSVSILVILVVVLSLSLHSTGINGFTAVYHGRCDSTSKVNSGLQFLVAVLSVLISVASDFFLRLAVSPTPQDVSRAHSQGTWLDIGTHSARNMRFVSPWRTLTWLLLIVSSAPLQLFSHASVFATSVYTWYAHAMVSESFFDGAPAWYPGVANPILASWAFDLTQANQSHYDFGNARERWVRMEPSECWSTYMKDPAGLQYYRHLALVVETTNQPSTGTIGWKGSEIWSNSSTDEADELGYPDFDPDQVNSVWAVNEWCQADIYYTGLLNNCADDYGQHAAYLNPDWGWDGSNSTTLQQVPEPWSFPWFSPTSHPLDNEWYQEQPFGTLNPDFNSITIKYCYAEPFVSRCKVFVANPILLSVVMVVFLKCLVSAFVFYKSWGLGSIQTLGDAIQYFMQQDASVDETPQFSRLQDDSVDTAPVPAISSIVPLSAGRPWMPTRKYWYMAVRKSVCLWTATPCVAFVACVVATILYLHLSVFHLGWHDYAFGEDMNSHYLNFYNGDYDPSISDTIVPLILIALLSNLSQLVIAPIYFLLNASNKIMFQAASWAKFALRAKRLRVSFPQNDADHQQLGDYAFGYPLVWGLLFAALRTALGWMFTQSLFMLPRGRLEYSSNQTEIDITQVGVLIGYSAQALVLSILLCVVVFFLLPLAISFRRLPDDSVIVGTNSLVIAAQCMRVGAGSTGKHTVTLRNAKEQDTKERKFSSAHSGTFSSVSSVQSPLASKITSCSTGSTTCTSSMSGKTKAGSDAKIWSRTQRETEGGSPPRHIQPLMWGVLDPGDELIGRPGYLGLGTQDEVVGKPVPGRTYVSSSVEWPLYSPR